MIIIKSQPQIDGIRKSSQLAVKILNETAKLIKPGISTLALNDFAHDLILKNNAIPAPLNYNGFPKSICTSINNVVCHGIPSKTEILKEGDLVNIDITTILDGYYGDVSASYGVGKISKENQQLLEVTKNALNMAIKSLAPGKILNNCVGKIIEPYVKKYGYSVVKELGGHGVGLNFHEEPFVYHFDVNEDDVVLKPGMIFTIEPMINASRDWRITLDTFDHWTIRTKDNSNSAQFEHTVLITNSGHEVLTCNS